ncbi:hypothetical protein [Paenibacillus lautus]|uniref:hypothetical protein n=1 Tax=Paenibacillus lautus TaxID=1401 RepID=UPI003D29A434
MPPVDFLWFERLGVYALIGGYLVWAYWTRKPTKAKLLPLLGLLIGSVVIQAAAASLLWFVLLFPITEAVLWSLTAVTLIEAILAFYRKQHAKWVALFILVLVYVSLLILLLRAM